MTAVDGAWRNVPLGDIASFVMGQAPPSSECNHSGVGTLFVKVGEFGDVYPKEEVWTTKPLKMARRGDVLLCVVGATVGKVNLGVDCAIGRSVAALRPGPLLDSHYLYHFLTSMTETLRSGSRGSAQGVVSKVDLAEISVPLPPLDEQRRIVAILEDHLGRVASSQAGLKRVAARLPLLRAAALQTKIMGESRSTSPPSRSPANLPADWRWMRLGDVAAGKEGFKRGPFGSALTKSTFVESGFQVYEQYAPINDDCLWARYFISKDHFDRLAAFSVKPGDFLVSCAGTMGRITRVPEGAREGVINQALLRLRVDPLVMDDEYFLWLMRSPFVQQQLLAGASGTAMVNLKAVKDLKEVLVPVPPLAVQRDLVQAILASIDATERLSRSLDQVLALLGRMRSGLLAAAFSGQLARESVSV